MSNLEGEAPLFGILKLLVEATLLENRQLRDEVIDDRLRSRERQEKRVNQLLHHLPFVLTQLFAPGTPSQATAPGPAQASSAHTSQATAPNGQNSPSTARTTPYTPGAPGQNEQPSPSAARTTPYTPEAPITNLPNVSVCHWFYPNSIIGCGLNIDDFSAHELTCSRGEVTCLGCLAQLRADQLRADQLRADQRTPITRSIAHDATPDGHGVRIDLAVLVEECERIITNRPNDGSPPMAALSADALRAVASYALRLSKGISKVNLATDGPTVGGEGAADAWGSCVHPIHVSAIYAAAETVQQHRSNFMNREEAVHSSRSRDR